MSAKVVSFINYKGGVGKTTTTYHVGCCLAQHHQKRVLMIDIDPQTNLTFLCAPYEKWKDFKATKGTIATMYKRFQEKKALDTKRYTWQTPIKLGAGRLPNLDLIPCDIDLLGEDVGGGQLASAYGSLEMLRKQADLFLRERRFLSTAIREVEDKYDFVLIDCPPNLYLMTQNALVASNYYVVTAIPDHLSTIGLTILTAKVRKIGDLIVSTQKLAEHTGSPLSVAKLAAIVFVKVRIGGTMVTVTHGAKMNEVASLPSLPTGICLDAKTTELIGYGEAAENSLPVWLHDSPNAKRAAQKHEYETITQKLLGRF